MPSLFNGGDDRGSRRSHDLDKPGGEPFRPLRLAAEDEDRLAQGDSLFLHIPGICQDNNRPIHEGDEFGIADRLGETDPIEPPQDRADRLAWTAGTRIAENRGDTHRSGQTAGTRIAA
jgi:hypothetical protein